MNSSASKRLLKELQLIQNDPISDINIKPINDDLKEWTGFIKGPEKTPYAGGTFKVNILFPPKYPFVPPKIELNTPIFHPNISKDGKICIDILKDDKWSASLTIQKVLISIISLFASPNPDDPLVPEVALLYKTNSQEYNRFATEWTKKYAMEK